MENDQIEELAQLIKPMVEKYLERMPMKDRRIRLRAFKRALEMVNEKWALLSW